MDDGLRALLPETDAPAVLFHGSRLSRRRVLKGAAALAGVGVFGVADGFEPLARATVQTIPATLARSLIALYAGPRADGFAAIDPVPRLAGAGKRSDASVLFDAVVDLFAFRGGVSA